jgi:hypothetical protein
VAVAAAASSKRGGTEGEVTQGCLGAVSLRPRQGSIIGPVREAVVKG